MSGAYNTYQDENVQYHQQQRADPYSQEYKPNYDDLIDDYAAPYAANAHHQTFNVDPHAMATGQHHRRPSQPLPSDPSFTMKSAEDASTENLTAYPPKSAGNDVDIRPFWQRIVPDSMACRLYLLTVFIETMIDLAIEADLLLRVHEATKAQEAATGQPNRMPVYLTIFALAHVFQFAMALDAVYARNTLQFLALTIFNAIFFGYSVVQIHEIQETVQSGDDTATIPIKVLTIIIPIVIAISEIAYVALGWKIYNEFGWKVYKFLGADRRIKKMYADYQIYECLVKFDVFFWAGFSVQFIWLVLDDQDWEYYVTVAALPLSLVVLVEGHLAARHENKWMMATFMSGCVGAMIYFVYKFVKVLMYRNQESYRNVWKMLTLFAVFAVVLLFATFIYSVMLMRNFGRGLKESLTRKDALHQRAWSQNPHRRAASANPNRMSID